MKSIIVLFTALIAFPSVAQWQLNTKESVLSFTSFKKEHIAENHYFKQVDGHIDDQGQVNVTINLASVDTNIAIRDERMKEHLFNVGKFANATIDAKIDMDKIAKIAVGTTMILPVEAKLSLHGVAQTLQAKVNVAKLADDKIQVNTVMPVLLSAPAFNLNDGIAKLKELAALPGISQTVPVNFTFSFSKQ